MVEQFKGLLISVITKCKYILSSLIYIKLSQMSNAHSRECVFISSYHSFNKTPSSLPFGIV